MIRPQLYHPLKCSYPFSFSFRRKYLKGDRGMERAGEKSDFKKNKTNSSIAPNSYTNILH